MKGLGIGGLIGAIIGLGVAEWLGNPNDAAYYAVVAIFAGIGTILGKALGPKPPKPKDD